MHTLLTDEHLEQISQYPPQALSWGTVNTHRTLLLSHIAALTSQRDKATAELAALKAPGKLDWESLVLSVSNNLSHTVWSECSEDWHNRCRACARDIVSRVRAASAEELADLRAKLEGVEQERKDAVHKQNEIYLAARQGVAHLRRRLQASENACRELLDGELQADRDRLAAELAAAKEQIAAKTVEVERVQQGGGRLELLQSFADEVLRIERICYPSSQVDALDRLVLRYGEQVKRESQRPRIVCLCGSTRFMEAFQEANLRETLAGNIVLSVGCNTKSDGDLFKGADAEEIKRRLDDLHKRKIDLCDEVLVLDVGGYIGESTKSEIEHAKKLGKPIRYLSAAPLSSPSPAAAESGLNLDHNEARALHRIVRAMHDGECPKCHALSSSDVMVKTGRHECPSCGFTVTAEESAAVLKIFGAFMERNLEVFESWRKSRGSEVEAAKAGARGEG